MLVQQVQAANVEIEVRIPVGCGVCGAASRAELVVPVFNAEVLRGVVDLDARLRLIDAADQDGVEALAAIVAAAIDW